MPLPQQQARLKASKRQWEPTLDLLDVAGRVYVRNPIPVLQPLDSRKARIHVKQGRLDKAQAGARERGLSVTDEVNYLTNTTFSRSRGFG